MSVATALIAALCWYGARTAPLYLTATPEEVSEEKYGNTFVQSVQIAKYLRQRTTPGELFFQWGLEPELYFLTRLRAPLPFAMSTSVESAPDPDMGMAIMMERLRKTPPQYLVYQPEWEEFRGVDEVADFIDKNYVRDAEIGYAVIFRKK